MRFDCVELKNFMSYEKATIPLEKGLYLIQGWNKDKETANAAGKSVILDSICWILTGKLPRNVSADAVINWKKKKQCEGTLNISDGEIKYKITRTRKPNNLDFWKGEEKITGVSIVETQELIEQHLGLNYDLFVNSVYFAQGSQSQFLMANDNTKKELLTDLLNLEVFDKINNNLKLKSKELSNSYLSLTSKQESLEKQIESIKASISEAKQFEEDFEKQKKKDLAQVQNQMNQDLESFHKRKKEIEEQVKKSSDIYSLKTSELSQAESGLSLVKDQLETTKEMQSKAGLERDKVKETLQHWELKASEDIAKLNSQVAVIDQKISYRKSEVNKILSDIQTIENKGTGKCFNCYQEISSTVLQAQIDQMKTEAFKIASDVQTEQSNKDRILQEVATYQFNFNNEKTDILADLDSKSQLASKFEEEVRQVSSQVLEQESKIRSLKGEISVEDSKIKNIEVSIEQNQNTYQTNLSRSQAQIESINKRVNSYVEFIANKTKELSEITENYQQLLKDLPAIEKEQEVNEFLITAFGNRGLKSYIFEQIVNEINAKANENLTYLFDTDVRVEFNVKETTKKSTGEISNKFETVVTLDGQSKELGSFSGGERRRMILAVDLALSKIIQNRSSKSVSLLVFDEYFEGLDRAGKEKMMDLLKEITNTTILVIDHNTEFQNLFDHVISVVKEMGTSTISHKE